METMIKIAYDGTVDRDDFVDASSSQEEAFNEMIANSVRSLDNTILSIRVGESSSEQQSFFNDDIVRIKMTETVNSGNSLKVGSACSNMVVCELRNVELDNLYGARLFFDKGLELEEGVIGWVHMGYFWITKVETLSEADPERGTTAVYRVTAYDALARNGNDKYTPTVTFPASISAVADDVCNQCGIEIRDGQSFPNLTIEKQPPDCTCREAIGYIAGCMGKFARMNRYDKLEFSWYTEDNHSVDRKAIVKRLQYLGGLRKSAQNPVSVEMKVYSTEETEEEVVDYSYDPNGYTNPWITQSMVSAVQAQMPDALEYMPLTVKWRGDPRTEAGDMILVHDDENTYYYVPVMKHDMKFAGGMSGDIIVTADEFEVKKFYNSNVGR